MNFLVKVALFGWIPVVIGLFMLFPPRRAVIAAFLIAWLFLPMAGFKVQGLPDYTKMSATCFGVFLAATIFDLDRMFSFRFRWVDIPILIWCCSPFVTSLLNTGAEIKGTGAYDGLSQVLSQVITWGLPYFIGRVYFSDLEGLRELAIGMLVGGMIYVPLCWFEIRMSPQLHKIVYGFYQHSWIQVMRAGGYRPMVFMQHGLMCAMWMCMTTLIGLWMWRTGALRRVWDMPINYVVPVMFVTAVLCKSTYALILLMLGGGLLISARWLRVKWAVALMMLVPATYIALRASAVVDGQNLIEWSNEMFGEERAQSLATRIDAENLLSVKAREKPLFGWGQWARSRVQYESGKDVVTDSLWILAFGTAGIVGLVALITMLLLPMYLMMKDYRIELWSHPALAPAVALAMVNMMYMFDHLFNAMVNPIFMLAAGGVCGLHITMQMRSTEPAARTLPRSMGISPMPSGMHGRDAHAT